MLPQHLSQPSPGTVWSSVQAELCNAVCAFSIPLFLFFLHFFFKVTVCVESYVVMTVCDGLHTKSLASLRMLPVESFYDILKIATERERMSRWMGRWIPNKERRGNSKRGMERLQ